MEENKRPLSITIIGLLCILGFILGMNDIYNVDENINYIEWYYNFFIVITILSLIAGIGLLNMKKMAAYLFIGYAPISHLVQLKMGTFNFLGAVVTIVVIIFITKHLDKMK